VKKFRITCLVTLALTVFSGRVFAWDPLGDAFSTLDSYSGGRLGSGINQLQSGINGMRIGDYSGVALGVSNFALGTGLTSQLQSGISGLRAGNFSGVALGISNFALGTGLTSQLQSGISGLRAGDLSGVTLGVGRFALNNIPGLESSGLAKLGGSMLQDTLSSKLLGGKFGFSGLESKIKEGVSHDLSSSNWLALDRGVKMVTVGNLGSSANFALIGKGISGAADMAANLIPRVGNELH